MSDERLSFRRGLLFVYVFTVLVFLIAPVLIVIPMSFSDAQFLTFPPHSFSLRWYYAFFDSSQWTTAAKTSIEVSVSAMLIATPIGMAAAYVIENSRHWLMRYVRIALMLPLMIPLIIIAAGLFLAFAKAGLWGTKTALILADTMLSLPFVITSIGTGLRSFDKTQEMVGRSLGMSPFRTFLLVTLPQIQASVFSAAIFAFIWSFDETIVALFISGGTNETLTKVMFTRLRDEIDPTIAAISTMLIVATSLLMGLPLIFRRKK